VHRDVSQSDDLRARDLGESLPESRRNTARGLAGHLQMVNHPDLDHLVALKYFFGGWEALFNLADGSPNIIQTLGVVSHKGIASR